MNHLYWMPKKTVKMIEDQVCSVTGAAEVHRERDERPEQLNQM